jgi:predicted CXXCH cytochrome family protein
LLRGLVLLCLLLACGVVRPAAGRAGEITLLTPTQTDLTLLSRNKIFDLVVKVTEAADLDRVGLRDDLNRRPFDPVGRHLKDGIYYLHYRVPLKKGANSFTLAPISRTVKIRFTPLSSLLNVDFEAPGVYLFHRSETIPAECGACHTAALPADAGVDRLRAGQTSPECYSCHAGTAAGAEWRHAPASTLQCQACHMTAGEGKRPVLPTGKMEGLCFECHVTKKQWLAKKHIHGPVGTGDCTICHDPHGSSHEFQLWADGKIRLCVICHEDKKEYQEQGRPELQVHGILRARGCVACHSPHATDHRFQLPSGINELCVGCHNALRGVTEGHPVQNHPIQGKEDPLRAGMPFTCTSCHNPHGSPYRFLLIGDHRGDRICAKCHGR